MISDPWFGHCCDYHLVIFFYVHTVNEGKGKGSLCTWWWRIWGVTV